MTYEEADEVKQQVDKLQRRIIDTTLLESYISDSEQFWDESIKEIKTN